MGADNGGVQEEDVQVGVAEDGGRGGEPPGLGPPVEPPPLAAPVSQPWGQVPPRGARAGDPQDGARGPAVVLSDPTMRPGLAGKQVPRPPPVGVRDVVTEPQDRPCLTGAKGRPYPNYLPAVNTH